MECPVLETLRMLYRELTRGIYEIDASINNDNTAKLITPMTAVSDRSRKFHDGVNVLNNEGQVRIINRA